MIAPGFVLAWTSIGGVYLRANLAGMEHLHPDTFHLVNGSVECLAIIKLLAGQFDRWNLLLEFFEIFFLISEPHFGRQQKCSDSPENSTNRLDDIKSGPNLVSDLLFYFSQKTFSVLVSKF